MKNQKKKNKTKSLPIVAGAVHGRVGSAIEQIVLLGPGMDKVWALLVVLAAAPVRRGEAAQLRRAARPVALAAPLGVRNHEHIVGTTPSPKVIQMPFGIQLLERTWLIEHLTRAGRKWSGKRNRRVSCTEHEYPLQNEDKETIWRGNETRPGRETLEFNRAPSTDRKGTLPPPRS